MEIDLSVYILLCGFVNSFTVCFNPPCLYYLSLRSVFCSMLKFHTRSSAILFTGGVDWADGGEGFGPANPLSILSGSGVSAVAMGPMSFKQSGESNLVGQQANTEAQARLKPPVAILLKFYPSSVEPCQRPVKFVASTVPCAVCGDHVL